MPNASQKQRDRQWADRIRAGDREAFKRLFRAYADALCTFAAQHVDDEALAEDLVQDVFCDLWDRREEWRPQGSVKAYLFRAVRNTSLDHLEHRRVVQEWEDEEKRRNPAPEPRRGPADALQHRELKRAMQEAVEELPERRRLVYRMARRHDMSYAEIASALDIAPKTVENQMGRALKALRDRLAKYAAFLQ